MKAKFGSFKLTHIEFGTSYIHHFDTKECFDEFKLENENVYSFEKIEIV